MGIVVPYQQIPLKLVSMTELRHDYSRRSWQRTFGLTQVKENSLFGRSVTRQVSGILALNNLPRVHLGMVLAHEAMHAWLYMNNFPHLTKRVEEGLCELVASRWLAQQTGPLVAHLQMNLQQNRSTIYGSGYRAAQKAFDKMGLQALLIYVRQHKTLPR